MNLMLLNSNAMTIPLADESVHCVVTSPPYWGLRDYGIGDQLGLEPTPEQYVENMVAVFREVRRVLRDDGTVWLNLGDSYARTGGWSSNDGLDGKKRGESGRAKTYNNKAPSNLKEKDLCGIPWRVAFALQADGWWLRSDIIWSKPNPMPESVTDRPTKAHEYLFLLTKSARYYYDADNIREGVSDNTHSWKTKEPGAKGDGSQAKPQTYRDYIPTSRNRRTVWHIATAPYSGAHFATYPPALVEPCIQAGTSERGCCPECGSPWERVVEKSGGTIGKSWHPHSSDLIEGMAQTNYMRIGSQVDDKGEKYKRTTLGWRPTCEHDAEPVPATVLDPFAGSGTTLQVARQLGRHGVGVDLSLEYLHLARQRLSLDALDAWTNGSKKNGRKLSDLPMFTEGL